MRGHKFDTKRGAVFLVADTPRPKTLIVHGFRRAPAFLEWWRPHFPDVGFVVLPGHATAPPVDEVSVAAWAEAWREAVGSFEEPPFVIGESLGALVALAMPARATVAVEPLLSVADLWPQRRYIEGAQARGVTISETEAALFDTPYDWALEAISAPTLVIAAAEPLLPERPYDGAPSLLTDADFARYAAHPKVEAVRIPGGHTLMDQARPGVLSLATAFFERHGAGAQSTP